MSPRHLALVGYSRRTRRTRTTRAQRRELAARATARRNRYLQLASAADRGELGTRPAHQTAVIGSGQAYHATCVCGWTSTKPTAERYAKGAATRHMNTVAKAEATRATLAVAA